MTGKPSILFFQAALQALAIDAAHALVVDDDMQADIHGAQQADIAGVPVCTEKLRPSGLDRYARTPDAVLDSIADLPAWLDARR